MKKTIRTREEVRAAFKAFMLERDAEQKAAQRRFKAHRQTRMAEDFAQGQSAIAGSHRGVRRNHLFLI